MASAERNYRLLIVDDDETDRRLYSRLLTRQAPNAFEITQMADGATGLAACRDQQYDCVLLDYNLPDMIGIEFLRDAAADGDLPCAVILATGQGNEAIAVEAMKHGAQDYLTKDRVTAAGLWRAITTAVMQTELRQRLARSLSDLTAANQALEREAIVRKATEAELRGAKEAAEQANQAKTRFVAMVTHELRTLLNGILGYAQLLRIEGGLSARQDAHVVAMMQAGQHLLEMIEQVLDFASIEPGRLKLNRASVRVRDLCERCIEFMGPVAAERALSLRMVSSHDAPRQLVADPARLRQVLLNLLGNALKYTHLGGVELRVLAGGNSAGLRIEVADTGPGIDAANRDRLFQDFERLDAVGSVEGAGMGLAIAARIIGLMNGAIGHIANPGGGSVFWLELPPSASVVPPPQEDPAPALANMAPAGPPLTGKRILLVDDIAMNRDVIGSFLRAAGHVAVLGESGPEAIRLASEQTFDLILMDVRMPGMDGLEATRRIRALPAPHGHVLILALTAYTFPEQIEQARDAGMDGHIAKPVNYANLTGTITATVAGTRPRWWKPSPGPPLGVANGGVANGEAPSRPRFDRALFEQTLAFLAPSEVTANLQQLRARNEQVLRMLDHPAAPELLIDAAHALASAVGMFGFVALSAVARNFEHALANAAPEAEGLALQVQSEARAAIETLDALLCEYRTQAA